MSDQCFDERFREQISEYKSLRFIIKGFQELAQAITIGNIFRQHWGIIGLRSLLSQNLNELTQDVISAGVLPVIVNLAKQTQYLHMKFEAIIILTFISAGTADQCQKVVDLGGIPLFISLLQGEQKQFAVQAVWGIESIAMSSIENRDKIIREGGVTKMTAFSRKFKNDDYEDNGSMLNNCYSALSKLCSRSPLPSCQLIREGILAICEGIAEGETDSQNIFSYLNTISHYCQTTTKQQSSLLKIRIVPKIVDILKYGQAYLCPSSLKILYYACRNNQDGINQLFSLDILEVVQKSIVLSTQSVRRYAYRLLGALAEGTKEQSQLIIQRQGLLMYLFAVFQKRNQRFVKDQILCCFANLAKAAPSSQLFHLYVHKRIIQGTVEFLYDIWQEQEVENVLMYLSIILNFCSQYEENRDALALFRANGEQILNKLMVYSNQRLLNCVKLLQVHFRRKCQ